MSSTESEELFNILSKRPFLRTDFNLLSIFGPEFTNMLLNLVDKYNYFSNRGMANDGWFFLTEEQQEYQIGMSTYIIRKHRKNMEALGLIQIKRKGIPPKLYYKINLNKFFMLCELTETLSTQNLKKLKVYILRSLRNNSKASTVFKENTLKKLKVYILRSLRFKDKEAKGTSIEKLKEYISKPYNKNKYNKTKVKNTGIRKSYPGSNTTKRNNFLLTGKNIHLKKDPPEKQSINPTIKKRTIKLFDNMISTGLRKRKPSRSVINKSAKVIQSLTKDYKLTSEIWPTIEWAMDHPKWKKYIMSPSQLSGHFFRGKDKYGHSQHSDETIFEIIFNERTSEKTTKKEYIHAEAPPWENDFVLNPNAVSNMHVVSDEEHQKIMDGIGRR